jgi:DNA-binding IclR family transcriptional regulator
MVSKGKNIQSITRAMDVINIELSLLEIIDLVGLKKSTVHGIITTLYNYKIFPNCNIKLN